MKITKILIAAIDADQALPAIAIDTRPAEESLIPIFAAKTTIGVEDDKIAGG